MKRFAVLLYLFSLVSLLVYSFSQIDLNLTLSSNPVYQSFQDSLIQLGYFNRPLSTLIYLLILAGLTLSYALFLLLAHQKKLSSNQVIKLSITTAVVLLFSYPAFSHDIFNYIFDARILALHRANPLTHTALDFPADLWTRFMRWTHRTYPYGPTWLPLTLVFYLAGLGKFSLTLLSFKVIGALSYLISLFSLRNILDRTKSTSSALSLTLFALNPLIIIETLVTSHLDAAMSAFMLLGISLYLNKSKLPGWLSLFISAGIKFISLGLLPFWYLFARKKLSFDQTINYSLITIYLLTIFVIIKREILPWYFITPFALTVLTAKSKFFLYLMFGLTLATLLRYSPFLYIGSYTPWVRQARDLLTLVFILLPFSLLIFDKASALFNSGKRLTKK